MVTQVQPSAFASIFFSMRKQSKKDMPSPCKDSSKVSKRENWEQLAVSNTCAFIKRYVCGIL
jgi:hypothetical protein